MLESEYDELQPIALRPENPEPLIDLTVDPKHLQFAVLTSRLPNSFDFNIIYMLPIRRVRALESFFWLHEELRKLYPLLLLPGIPPAALILRSSTTPNTSDELETARRRLCTFLRKIARNPIFLQCPAFVDFLLKDGDMPTLPAPVAVAMNNAAAHSGTSPPSGSAITNFFRSFIGQAPPADTGIHKSVVVAEAGEDEYFEEKREQVLELEKNCLRMVASLNKVNKVMLNCVESSKKMGSQWMQFASAEGIDSDLAQDSSRLGQTIIEEQAICGDLASVWQASVCDAFSGVVGDINGVKAIMNYRTKLLDDAEKARMKMVQAEETHRKVVRSFDIDPSKASHAKKVAENAAEMHRRANAAFIGACDTLRGEMRTFEQNFFSDLGEAIHYLSTQELRIEEDRLKKYAELLVLLTSTTPDANAQPPATESDSISSEKVELRGQSHFPPSHIDTVTSARAMMEQLDIPEVDTDDESRDGDLHINLNDEDDVGNRQ